MRQTLVVLSTFTAVALGAGSALAANAQCVDPSRRTYDVVVVGAGTSGIMAAIQAARHPGTAVALLESGTVIGGQAVAAGVSTMDGGYHPPVRSGLFLEYVERVNAHYYALGIWPHTCYGQHPTNTCSEPHVSEAIFHAMLDLPVGAGSTLCFYPQTTVVEVLHAMPATVVGVRTGWSPSDVWSADVVIDATEYGDLLPMTFGDYRVGNWRRFGGQQPSPDACVQDITYTAILRDYSPAPAPQIPAPGGYDPAMENMFWTWVSDNPPPFPGHPYPYSCPWPWATFNNYRGLPDSAASPGAERGPTRTQSNYEVTDFPGYWIEDCRPAPYTVVHSRGDLPISFIEDPAVRAAKICEAKHLTMQFLHYMQRTNPEEQPEWSIADDEYASPNACYGPFEALGFFERMMPPIPYVRESRRVVSIDPLQGFEIKRTPTQTAPRHPTALAVGDYVSQDMHGCAAPENLEPDLDSPSDFTTTGGPFQIPFATFIPVVLDGFVPAEKNLGYSRIAATAARMQPSTMLVGQAAGALAAIAAGNGIQPRAVRVLDVQRELLEAADPVALAQETYADLAIGGPSWRDAQVVSLYAVMGGVGGSFQPGTYVTRTETVQVLDNVFTPTPTLPDDDGMGTDVMRDELAHAFAVGLWGALPAEPVTSPIFVDVLQGNPRRGAIERLYTEGYVKPCTTSGQTKWFCPNGIAGRARRDALALAAAETILQTWP